jgi:hypothetical protein
MIVLAQASGDELSGFLGQPIVGPLLSMTCFFFILLVLVIAALVYVRRRKALAAQAALPPAPSFYGDSSPDMPDLDLLVNTAGLAQETPISPPAAPAPPRSVRKGTFHVKVNDGSDAEAVEVLVVMRDIVDGRLIVQMGDKVLQNVNSDIEFKERFNKLMRELAQVVVKPGGATTSPAVETTATEASSETPTETPSDTTSDPETPAASLADLLTSAETAKPKSAPPPPVSVTGPMPGDLPSFKLADNPVEKRRRGQKAEIKPVPELNIAGAIEAYLQHKLRHSPEYAGRSIHIYPSPDGGVSIEVDGLYYDAVGDIEDVAVREYIATAIQEWQERH